MEDIKLKIRYFSDDTVPGQDDVTNGDWVDVYCSTNTLIEKGKFSNIPLGFTIELPEGYETYFAPVDNTTSRGLIIIDPIIRNNYDGPWMLPVMAVTEPIGGWDAPLVVSSFGKNTYPDGVFIHKGTKIARFRLIKCQPNIKFI